MQVAMTGGTGSIGRIAIPKLLENKEVRLTLLFRNSPVNQKKAKKLETQYADRVRILYGDTRSEEDCNALVQGADYVLHLAAMVPPAADHDAKGTWEVNYHGSRNVIDAIIRNGNTARLVDFSSVATYGHRGSKHLWGRVGDPLLPSVFDSYSVSKVRAERHLLESDLKHWVILRISGVLYDNLLMNNIGDGLIFHTPLNIAIEWVTASDLARLLFGIVSEGAEKPEFWNRIYNIGGGAAGRETGFETYENGFRKIGGSAKKMLDPRWLLQRNFHCFWFSDSDVAESFFHFQTEGTADFWETYFRHHRIYQLGRIVPPALIRALIFNPLLKNSNAPAFWAASGDEARMMAFYGGIEEYRKIPDSWDQIELLSERPDYESLKTHTPDMDLSHGYDESKPDEALDLSDMKEAAAFRGGEVVSAEMTTGDLRTKLSWKCHNGHVFESAPYTILKAGHWCPVCCSPDYEWNFDALSKHIPFYAQVWYDSHEKDEDIVYTMDEDLTCHISRSKETES